MQTQQANLLPQQLYETYMKPFAATLATSVATLQADGARTFVVLNFNEYARLVAGERTALHLRCRRFQRSPETYGAAIWSSLAAAGVNFVPADISSLFTYVSQNPAKFGFTAASVLASNPACGSTEQPRVQPRPACRAQRRADPFMGGRSSSDHGGTDH